MQKVSYEINKHKASGNWVVWKITEYEDSDRGGISNYKVYSGTKKECQEKKKELMKSERTSRKIRKA